MSLCRAALRQFRQVLIGRPRQNRDIRPRPPTGTVCVALYVHALTVGEFQDKPAGPVLTIIVASGSWDSFDRIGSQLDFA